MQVGPLVITIESKDAVLVSELTGLFEGFLTSDEDHRATRIEVSTTGSATSGPGPLFELVIAGNRVGGPVTRRQLDLLLTRRLNRAVLDAEEHLLHIHAGAATRNGSTVLVIGNSFAGKSTLVAKLVAEGWGYLSDEQLGVTASGTLVAFPRPITLRAASWSLFDQVNVPDAASMLPDRIEIAPTDLGSIYVGEPLRPTVVIRPDVSSDDFSVVDLSCAQLLSVLVADSLDMERAGDDGLQAMISIVTHARGYGIAGKDLTRTYDTISAVTQRVESVRPVVTHHVVGSDEDSNRVAGSQGWLFGDGSSALYSPASGVLLQINDAGFHEWESLAHPQRRHTAERDTTFRTGLVEAGFLRTRP